MVNLDPDSARSSAEVLKAVVRANQRPGHFVMSRTPLKIALVVIRLVEAGDLARGLGDAED
jgi:hypothetical protein